MRVRQHETKGLFTAALLAVLVGLVGLAGAIRLAQSAAELGPVVGDIISFDPSRRVPRDAPPRIEAEREGQVVCILDLATIHRLGGSLVIETRSPRPTRTYGVHWAGQRSSDDPRDCGRSAELVMTEDNLEMLAMAAGGFGVSHRRLVPTAAWTTGGAPAKTR